MVGSSRYAVRRSWGHGAWLAVAFALLPLGACGPSSDDLDYAAVAGEPCEDCQSCSDIIGSCICETCTEVAVDVERKQLLHCGGSGVWEVSKLCPGGVSVACARYGYDITCLDENGEPQLGNGE